MKKNIRIGLWLLPLALVAACAPIQDEPESDDPAALAPQAQATSAIQMDTSALTPLADAVIVGERAAKEAQLLPANRLTAEAFQPKLAAERLLRTNEPFSAIRDDGVLQHMESDSWQIRASNGHLVVVRKQGAAVEPDTKTDAESLRAASRARLRAFGVPEEEVGRVLQRDVLVQTREAGVASAPQIDSHKTFILRAIGGVEVQGHRAVLTHTTEGAFERAIIHWPALAAGGHAWRTPLSLRAIEERTARAVAKEEGTIGKVSLRWKYMPEELPSGEVRLRLVVGARAPVTSSDGSSEPRELDVDIDAAP